MAKITLIFAALLVALGLAGYLGTGSRHPTALIPAAIGLLLVFFGGLSFTANKARHRLFMHLSVTIATLGLLGVLVEIVRSNAASHALDPTALAAKLAMAVLLFVYDLLCVRSFIAARRARKV
jgi:hypothetical protein